MEETQGWKQWGAEWMEHAGEMFNKEHYTWENVQGLKNDIPVPEAGEVAVCAAGFAALAGACWVAKKLVCDCKKWAFIPNPLHGYFHKEKETPAQKYGDKVLLAAVTTAMVATGIVSINWAATAFLAGAALKLVVKTATAFAYHIQGKPLSELLPKGHDNQFTKKMNVVATGLASISAYLGRPDVVCSAFAWAGYQSAEWAYDKVIELITT